MGRTSKIEILNQDELSILPTNIAPGSPPEVVSSSLHAEIIKPQQQNHSEEDSDEDIITSENEEEDSDISERFKIYAEAAEEEEEELDLLREQQEERDIWELTFEEIQELIVEQQQDQLETDLEYAFDLIQDNRDFIAEINEILSEQELANSELLESYASTDDDFNEADYDIEDELDTEDIEEEMELDDLEAEDIEEELEPDDIAAEDIEGEDIEEELEPDDIAAEDIEGEDIEEEMELDDLEAEDIEEELEVPPEDDVDEDLKLDSEENDQDDVDEDIEVIGENELFEQDSALNEEWDEQTFPDSFRDADNDFSPLTKKAEDEYSKPFILSENAISKDINSQNIHIISLKRGQIIQATRAEAAQRASL